MKYRVIYADPPWDFKCTTGNGWGQPGRSTLEYPVMPVERILQLPVRELGMPDSVLFLWTINKYLESSYDVARAWGYKPSTMLVWAKSRHGIGLGGTFTITTEFLLYATRGKAGAKERFDSTWFESKRGPHSRKPSLFREIIDRAFDGPKIELFAREAFLGWDAWGNEVISDVDL